MEQIVRRVHRRGLHFAFLDHHNLGALSFELFKTLRKLEHIDILVHISVADLQRNVDRYASEDYEQFNTFAPGWRDVIDYKAMNKTALRSAILTYWSDQVASLGLTKARHSVEGEGIERPARYSRIIRGNCELYSWPWYKARGEKYVLQALRGAIDGVCQILRDENSSKFCGVFGWELEVRPPKISGGGRRTGVKPSPLSTG